MIKTETWLVVNERELNELISSEYGVPYSYQQQEFLAEDTVHFIDTEDYGSYIDNECTIEEWQQAWANRSGEFHDSMRCERGEEPFLKPPNGRILGDLRDRGLIPGEFYLHIWW